MEWRTEKQYQWRVQRQQTAYEGETWMISPTSDRQDLSALQTQHPVVAQRAQLLG